MDHLGKPPILIDRPHSISATFPLMCSVYSEEHSDSEMDRFIKTWPNRCEAQGFDLLSAHLDDELVGFIYGHNLSPSTSWWSGALDEPSADVTSEWPGRTFAIIDLNVKRDHRRNGIAKKLHHQLIAARHEERATLLVRTTNEIAFGAYQKWGYRTVGRIKPFQDSPIFNAMIKTLRAVT